jgi:hypothetical protein
MMTPEEHKLIMGMFGVQMLTVKALATALSSQGVLASDDTQAYFA